MLKIAKKYKFDVDFIAVNYRNKFPQTELRLKILFDKYYSDPINWSLIFNVEMLKTNDDGFMELVINEDLIHCPDSRIIELFSELRKITEVK